MSGTTSVICLLKRILVLDCGKSFSIEGIQSVEIVKNPWYYFWGIKSMPGGWLYSIAPGGRAIELIFNDIKKVRLGTNRPEEIKQRIDQAIGKSN